MHNKDCFKDVQKNTENGCQQNYPPICELKQVSIIVKYSAVVWSARLTLDNIAPTKKVQKSVFFAIFERKLIFFIIINFPAFMYYTYIGQLFVFDTKFNKYLCMIKKIINNIKYKTLL